MRHNSRIKRFPLSIFVFGRWALGAGRWALGAGRWALGPGPWALGPGPWALGPGRWALGAGPWALGAGCWALGAVGVGGEEKQDVESEVRVGGKSWWPFTRNYSNLTTSDIFYCLF